MDEIKNVYCSYLLRIWIEPTDGEQWRFSLEDTRTGKRKGFACLKNMFAYLEERTMDKKKEAVDHQIPGINIQAEEEK